MESQETVANSLPDGKPLVDETQTLPNVLKIELANFTSEIASILGSKLDQIRTELKSSKQGPSHDKNTQEYPCNQESRDKVSSSEDELRSSDSKLSTNKKNRKRKETTPNSDGNRSSDSKLSTYKKKSKKGKRRISVSPNSHIDIKDSSSDAPYDSDFSSKLDNISKRRKIDSPDSILTAITEDLQEKEKLSPPVTDPLAQIFNSIWESKLKPEKIKERQEKTLRPENLPFLKAKKVNEEIWSLNTGQMPHVRSADVKLQKIQDIMSKALVPVLQITEELICLKDNPEHKVDPSKGVNLCVDAMVLASQANTLMDNYRREQFRQVLPNNLRSLCQAPKTVSEKLFGDDIDKRIQDIQSQSKLKDTLSDQKKGYSSNYNNRHSYPKQGSKNYHSFSKKGKTTSGKQYQKWNPNEYNNQRDQKPYQNSQNRNQNQRRY